MQIIYPNFNKLPRQNLVTSWQVYQNMTLLQIEELQYFSKNMEEQFNQKKDGDDWSETFEHFSRITFLTQIYTVLEYNLRFICEQIEKHNYQKFSIKDLSGSSYILKAKVYLQKTIEIDIEQFKEWHIIKDFQKVRNCIVHNYCRFDSGSQEKPSELTKIFKGNSSYKIVTETKDMRSLKLIKSFYIIDGKSNYKFMSNIASLFETLYKRIIDFHSGLSDSI